MTQQRPLHVELPITVKTYDIDFLGIVSNIAYVRWLLNPIRLNPNPFRRRRTPRRRRRDSLA